MNNQKILIQRWKKTRTELGDYLKKYQKLNKKTQDSIQSVLNSVNIKPSDLNKAISYAEKNRLNRKITEWEEIGLLVGYFAYKANEVLSKNYITYNDMLEILIYGSFMEERKTLDEYDKALFTNIAISLYEQGIDDIKQKGNEKWSLTTKMLASFLLTPVDGVLWSEYTQALALTNSQEIKKIAINNISQEVKNEVEDNVYQKAFQKQRNRLISITDNGISGRLDLQATVIGNLSYLQAGIDTNTRYVRFVSDLCEHVTKMCANMDGIIFDIKGDNKFHRWYGQDSKSLKYEEIECFGLIPGINLPPIFHHFHWCHSTLTYQTQLSTDEIRKLMNNGNIRDEQPIENFAGKKKENNDTLSVPDVILKLYNSERELNQKEKYILDKYITDDNISITTDDKILMTYRPKDDKILVNPNNKNIEYYDVTKVLTHETMHLIDNRTGFTKSNKEVFTNYLDNANKYIIKNEKHFANLFNNANIKENMDISDLFASITRNKIKGNYAHNLDYWKHNLTRESEMVANLGNIYISGNKEIIDIIESIPSLNKLYGKVKKWYEENI